MAVTLTNRLGLTRWSAGADPFSRAQMDSSHAALESLAAIDGQGTFAGRPAAGKRGFYYFVVDPGHASDGLLFRDTGSSWVAISRKPASLRVPHTFTVNGDILVPNGDYFYIPPFFVPVPAGQTVLLSGLRYAIRTGTEVTFDVRENGATIAPGITGLKATPTPTSTTYAGTPLSNGTALNIAVTAIVGTPRNLSVSLYLDYSA